MEWVIVIGMLVGALLFRAAMKYALGQVLSRHPHGLLASYVGRKWSVAILIAVCAVWFLAGRQTTSSTTLTPEWLAADLRAGQQLPRRVGVQVRLEQVEADGNKVILAHIVDVDDEDELAGIMANIRQWDSSGLCDNLMQMRTANAGIELVAKFRTRNGRNYRSLTLNPTVCES